MNVLAAVKKMINVFVTRKNKKINLTYLGSLFRKKVLSDTHLCLACSFQEPSSSCI